MASKLLDPRSNDTKPVFLRNVYDDVTELSERDRRKHRVLKIRLFKEKGLVGHEFLILDVFDGSTLVRLLVERRPSRREAEKPQHRQWRNLLGVDFLVSDSDDIVKKVPEGFSPMRYHLITTLSSDTDEAPTFAVVCQILWEVQQDAPNYTLRYRQCYWFVGTAVERVKHEFTKLEGKGKFTMQVKDGSEATRRGKPGGALRPLKVYPKPKAAQYVVSQIKREEDVQKEDEETARQQMQAAVKNAITMAQEERQQSKEGMRRAIRPLLITPEAYQRTHWANIIANVEEEFQKSKQDLERAAHPLLEIPVAHHADTQYWQSVFRNVTTESGA